MRAPHVPFDKFPLDHKKQEGYTYGLGVRTFYSNTYGGQLSNIGELTVMLLLTLAKNFRYLAVNFL